MPHISKTAVQIGVYVQLIQIPAVGGRYWFTDFDDTLTLDQLDGLFTFYYSRDAMTNWCPASTIPTVFMLDALPSTALPISPGLGQAPNMLACIPS